MDHEINEFTATQLDILAVRMRDTAQAHHELLHRPERALHERQITFYTEVAARLDKAAAGFRKPPPPNALASVAGVLGEQYADHVAVGTPEEVAK